MALRIVEQAGRTDVGRQRNANEDSLVVRPPLFAVADGMGGAKAGEVASAVAVEAVEAARDSTEPAEAQLAGIVRDANRRIYDLAAADESRRGMGTTLTLAKVHGDEVSLAHVGDSRAYRLRDGRAPAADPRPLAGRGAGAERPDHRRGRRAPSTALDHHARARSGARRGGGHLHAHRPRGRRLPDLLRRAHVDDLGRRGHLDPAVGGVARRGGRGAGARGEPERRQGQHHGDPVPAGRGGGERPRARTRSSAEITAADVQREADRPQMAAAAADEPPSDITTMHPPAPPLEASPRSASPPRPSGPAGAPWASCWWPRCSAGSTS